MSIVVIALALLLKALAASAVVAVVVALLCWDKLKTWFGDHTPLYESDRDNIAFSLQEKLASNEFKTVYGIFNKRTEKIIDAEAIISQNIDQQLAVYHGSDALVVYE